MHKLIREITFTNERKRAVMHLKRQQLQGIVMLQLQSGFLIPDLEVDISQREMGCVSLMAGLQKAIVSNCTASDLKADKWIVEAREIKWFGPINRLNWHVCATDKLKRLSLILTAFRGSKTEPDIKE